MSCQLRQHDGCFIIISLHLCDRALCQFALSICCHCCILPGRAVARSPDSMLLLWFEVGIPCRIPRAIVKSMPVFPAVEVAFKRVFFQLSVRIPEKPTILYPPRFTV